MKKNKYIGLLYLAPWLIGFLVFVIYPFAMALVLSFTNYNLMDAPSFIGIKNYMNLLSDETFKTSIIATIKFVFISVPVKLIFALFIAYILSSKLKGINFFRATYYIPSVLGANIAISVLWQFIFKSDGLMNMILGTVGVHPIDWFSNPNLAMLTIVLLRAWQFGSAMVIFLAAIKDIPKDYYEAASLDGASKWKQFTSITLPQLTPVIFFNLIMQLVQAFQEFDGPYLITGGGPLKSTYMMSMYIYDSAFKTFSMGYASALSWVLFIMIFIFTMILFKSQDKWVFYSDGGK